MRLADALDQTRTVNGGQRFMLDKIAAKMSDTDAADLYAAARNPDIGSGHLSRALREMGMPISISAIDNWRKAHPS